MDNRLLQSKAVRAVVVVLVVGGFAGYEFGIKAAREKAASWEGEIVEKERDRKWWRGFKSIGEADYHYYTHYWVVRTDDGDTLDVDLPYHSWDRGAVGARAVKVKGERWPRPADAADPYSW
jgi:hypothetical protein